MANQSPYSSGSEALAGLCSIFSQHHKRLRRRPHGKQTECTVEQSASLPHSAVRCLWHTHSTECWIPTRRDYKGPQISSEVQGHILIQGGRHYLCTSNLSSCSSLARLCLKHSPIPGQLGCAMSYWGQKRQWAFHPQSEFWIGQRNEAYRPFQGLMFCCSFPSLSTICHLLLSPATVDGDLEVVTPFVLLVRPLHLLNRKPHAWLSRKPTCLAILRCRWAKLIRHDQWKVNPSTRFAELCMNNSGDQRRFTISSVHSSLGETRNHSQSIIKTVSSAMHRDIYWNWMVWFNDAITYQAYVYNRVYFTDWNSLLAVRCVHAGRQWQCRVLGRLARQCRRACLTQSPIPLWHQVGHGGTSLAEVWKHEDTFRIRQRCYWLLLGSGR